MQIERSNYIDCDAMPDDCDIVQIKHDGHFAYIVVKGGVMKHYSRSGRLVREKEVNVCDCVLLGEYMYGTERAKGGSCHGDVMLFDCLQMGCADYRQQPYHVRADACLVLAATNGSNLLYAPPMGIGLAASFWGKYVEDGTHEGLIYRRSTDTFPGDVYRHKAEFDVTLRVVGYTFSESERYGGLVKSIIGEAADGSRTLVGGLDDANREELTCNQDRKMFHRFEATCNGRFSSGKLRHPRFKRWEGGE